MPAGLPREQRRVMGARNRPAPTIGQAMKPLYIRSESVLNAVDRWASGCYMLRELELLVSSEEEQAPPAYDKARKAHQAHSAGRLDALLLPFAPWDTPFARKIGGWAYNVARLIGIEVKVDRSDFNNGLKKQQFERYGAGVSALYIATPAGLVKTPEVPEAFGHLVITEGDHDHQQERFRCVCKRHPQFTENQPPPQMFWKLISMITKNHHARERELELRWTKARKEIGKAGAEAISAALGAIGQ
jgi:hypothetical protein